MRKRPRDHRPRLCLLVLAALIAAFAAGCGPEPSRDQTPSAQGWRVLSRTESDAGGHRSLYYFVLVPPGCDRRGLESISREIVEQAKREKPFSRVWMQFYDYPELHDPGYGGPPLGYVRYGGATNPRSATEDGEYAEMTYAFRFAVPDWSERPSQRDVDLAVHLLQLWREAEAHGRRPSERRLIRKTAQHFGVTPSQVVAAVARVDAWVGPQRGGRAW